MILGSAVGKELKDIFGQVGAVVSASVIRYQDTGRSKGFGFVEMSTDDEAKKAIADLNGKTLDGRAIVVNEAKPMDARSGGGVLSDY